MMANEFFAKQLEADKARESAARGDEGTLCDIIAQQREFQLRQESRSPTSPSSLATTTTTATGTKSRRLTEERDQLQHQSKEQEQPESTQSSQPTKHHQKRKFSLSQAMSNLTLFGPQATPKQQPSGAPCGDQVATPPVRPVRQRSSLAISPTSPPATQPSSGAETPLDPEHKPSKSTRSSVDNNQLPAAVQANAAERKRGFVHKAIRRGSKMFDSMLLSSAMRQTQQDKDQSCELNESSEQQQHHHQQRQRVQFEAVDPKDDEELDSAVEQLRRLNADDGRRRRKLRLGSIQHDLRRALSLSSSAHSQRSASRGPPTATDQSPPDSPTKLPSPVGEHADVDDNKRRHGDDHHHQLAASSSPTSIPSQPEAPKPLGPSAKSSSARLKRKNSLFAPLTAAASSAFYHAHSSSGAANRPTSPQQHKAAQVDPNQQTSSPAAAQPTTAGPTAANPNGAQSASFSLCQDHSRTYKLIIFGSSAVGKTSLIQRFLYGHFPATHKPTVEELHSNKYNIPELGEIYLEILDTSGTFEFPAMRRLSIEKGDAFILVYSVADEASWQEVVQLHGLISEEKRQQQRQQQQQQQQATTANGSAQATATRNESREVSQTTGEQSGSDDASKPPVVSSVYAAATRLAAASRRTSSSPSLSKSLGSTRAAGQQLKCPPPTQPGPGKANNLSKKVELQAALNSQYSNSQLSKLLSQQAAASENGHPNGKLTSAAARPTSALARSLRNDGDDDDDDEDENNDGAEAAEANKTDDQQEVAADQKNSFLFECQRSSVPPIVVVANKCDLDTSSHQVDSDEVEKLVRNVWRNSFVKCSAKEALNIDRVFKELLSQARAPEILSQFVIDDHQQRRQSLPVLKNQLSAHHVKGLRNLYQQQQAGSKQQQFDSRPLSSTSDAESQCAII